MNPVDKQSTLALIKKALNDDEVSFRDGQWETIDALVHHNKKILLVQRTGWGKSIVYFISARMMRDQGKGPAIIISPLLALMRNQIAAAERIGIKAFISILLSVSFFFFSRKSNNLKCVLVVVH